MQVKWQLSCSLLLFAFSMGKMDQQLPPYPNSVSLERSRLYKHVFSKFLVIVMRCFPRIPRYSFENTIWLLGIPRDSLSVLQIRRTKLKDKMEEKQTAGWGVVFWSRVCVCVCERERESCIPITVQRPPAKAKLVNKFLLLTNIRTFLRVLFFIF